MPKLSIDHIEVAKSEMILVFWHKTNRLWWATIGPANSDDVRLAGEGATAIAAIGELFAQLGGRIEDPS